MTLKYIWFDLGYTLVYSKREKILQDILVSMNKRIDTNKIKMAYHLTDKFFMREHKGLLCKSKEEFMPYYLKKLLEVLNIKVDRNILLHEINKREQKYQKIWYTYDSAVSVLTTLKQNSIRSGIISNWDNTSRKVLCQNNLDSLLDEIVISSEVGYSKPQKEIFDFCT
ncbi:HAD hydrolase-like protein [Clostridium sp. DMHC 10]|uniref:HAD family hydrolase n=1 Tax=Clostridium sp. DMHC 10 TaxID=747377 RepID=UPI00069E394D|nr:HAD hydrolase-like protein [Clostridium sp. DMHC 10]